MTAITVGGGGARLDSFCQILSDVLQKPVRQLDSPQAIASLGAALLTFERLGYIESSNLHECVICGQEFQPITENKETYNQNFQHFLEFFEANQEIYKQLNQ
jgi:sugar (pentulose or hexulose) kinase